MAEWLVEDGIGECRAICVEGDHIVAAMLDWPGGLAAGQVEDARLVSRTSGSSRGTARFANGEEALVSGLPASASEGSTVRLEITRPAIGEKRRRKRAQARLTIAAPSPAPTLLEALESQGEAVRQVARFPLSGWDDLMADAFAGEVAFAGGTLLLSPTPAMTLIDIDGTAPPPQLAMNAARAIARAVRRLDIGGSIGIDFPTLTAKDDRRAVDTALAEALAGWPHERTAMNGFGFVQLVARLARPSILHLVSQDPAGAAARNLLRRAEGVPPPGTLLLTCHPLVAAKLSPDWLDELMRRAGRKVRVEADPALALEAGFAQSVQA